MLTPYFFSQGNHYFFIPIFLIYGNIYDGLGVMVMVWVFGVRVMLMELGVCGAGCSGFFGVRALYRNIEE